MSRRDELAKLQTLEGSSAAMLQQLRQLGGQFEAMSANMSGACRAHPRTPRLPLMALRATPGRSVLRGYGEVADCV